MRWWNKDNEESKFFFENAIRSKMHMSHSSGKLISSTMIVRKQKKSQQAKEKMLKLQTEPHFFLDKIAENEKKIMSDFRCQEHQHQKWKNKCVALDFQSLDPPFP